MTSEIQVYQINLHRSNDATGELMAALSDISECIILIQEPYVYREEIRGIGNRGRVYCGRGGARPRAGVVVVGDMDTLALPQFTNEDQATIMVKLKLGNIIKNFIFVSRYMAFDAEGPLPDDQFRALVEYSRTKGYPMIIGCDANAHHEIWGSTNSNKRGNALIEYIYEVNLEVANRGSTPTFINRIRQEVIDITIGTNDIIDNITGWRVTNKISLSDHRLISFRIKGVNKEVCNFRNPKNTCWEDFRRLLETDLPNIQQADTKEELNQQVKLLNEAITQAFHRSCPISKKRLGKKWWWTERLDELRKATRKTYRKAFRVGTQEQWDKYKEINRKYKKEIRKRRRDSWRDYCQAINGISESARLAKIMASSGKQWLGTLQREDGSWTESTEETIHLLMETHFPGDNNTGRVHRESLPGANQRIADEVVTKDRIKWAIGSFQAYKAPGIDGIYPIFLQKGLEHMIDRLLVIFKGSLVLGHIPEQWQTTRVIFIPKPGKEYSKAKSFRPINLMSFLLKTLERLINSHLQERYIKVNPLHQGQHAYTKGMSTDSAIHTLVRKVEKALEEKSYSLGVFFDIEGAFDKLSIKAVRQALLRKKVNIGLINWIITLLRSRKLTVKIGGCEMEFIVTRGCPQGGCLSPLLWIVVMDELLTRLSNQGFFIKAFADDGVILIIGKFLDVICHLMRTACRILEEWCEEIGLTINPRKTNMVLFTRRRTMDGFRAPRLFGTELQLVSEVRYLGVILDSKLTWRKHIEEVVRRTTPILFATKRIVGANWGANPKVMRWLFYAVIRPKLVYGAVAWWHATEKEYIRKRLATIQRLACIGITGAFKTAPGLALDVILGIPPLDTFIKGEAMQTCRRLIDWGQWRGTSENSGHTKILGEIRKHLPILEYIGLRVKNNISFERNFNYIIPNREWWGQDHDNMGAEILIFTDGSRIEDQGTGAGIFIPSEEVRQSVPLGRYATVFQAEVIAILEATRLVAEGSRSVFICSDSQAAIKALTSYTISSSIVEECREELNRLASKRNVSLVWVPGHSGIQGNEEADSLAKEGALSPFWGPEPVVPLSRKAIRGLSTKWQIEELNRAWRKEEGCRQAKHFMKECNLGNSNFIIGTSRTECRLLTQIITGHGPFHKHLARMGLVDDSMCPVCGREEDTAAHFLGNCGVYDRARFQILRMTSFSTEEFEKLSWKDVLAYARATGRF